MSKLDVRKLGAVLAATKFDKEFNEATLRVPRPARPFYLGMSGLGKCQAELWAQFHSHAVGVAYASGVTDPKLQRIFDLGHAIEDEVMKSIWQMDGYEVISTQQAYEDFGGNLRGDSDLVISTPEYPRVVADVKSMNEWRFKQFQADGVKASNWPYYVQLTTYGGYELVQPDAILLIAYNKNTSELASEYVPYSPEDFASFREKAHRIITSEKRPPCERGNGRVKYCSCPR